MKRDSSNRNLAIAAAAALVALGTWSGQAGDLEPPGPPAPTMQTLGDVPGSWYRILPSDDGEADGCNSSRFKCVMNGEAVLDLETGLVWERAPTSDKSSGQGQKLLCTRRTVGGRRGWRLPAMGELTSLVDDSQSDFLPAGHPFTNLHNAPGDHYVASDVYRLDSNGQVASEFALELYNGMVHAAGPNGLRYGWCVRGNQDGGW